MAMTRDLIEEILEVALEGISDEELDVTDGDAFEITVNLSDGGSYLVTITPKAS
jgi:hypothetical protein